MRREEYKFPINRGHQGFFSMIRPLEPLFVEHGSRQINSVYFDNAEFDSFYLGEEGVTPRRKVRARWYGAYSSPPDRSNVRFELKITHHHDREKQSYSIDEAEDRGSPYDWSQDIIRGALRPVCKVSYDRNYYISHLGIRVTLDRNIRHSVSNGIWDNDFPTLMDDMSVVEIKCAEKFIKEDIHLYIPSIRQRFSKYSRAVIMLNLA